MDDDDLLVDAVDVLKRRREERLAEADKLAEAISTLDGITPGSSPADTPSDGVEPQSVTEEPQTVTEEPPSPKEEPPSPKEEPPSPKAQPPSVKTLMLELMAEGDRDWSTNEILTEYDSRGTPVHGKDPGNAIRAALAEALKAEQIIRTQVGRYKSQEWAAQQKAFHP